MKSRCRIGVLVVAAGVALVAPVVLKATQPPNISRPVRTAQTVQSALDTSGSAQYQFTTIDVPAGVGGTFALGLNNPGLASGFYIDVNGHANGFLWQKGKVTTVDHPGAEHTLLGQVSNSGLVVGNYGPFLTQHAAVYHIATGTWITLPDVPNLPVNIGNGINP